MTKAIWKFPLEITDLQSVDMPEGAVVLTVQAQKNVICLWAMIDVDQKKERRNFRIVGTGHAIVVDHSVLRYIGTAQLLDGAFVAHVFESNEVIE